MVNTIWKENFLIMCSKLCLNARDSGHFAQLLLICRNYSLQTLCGAPHNVCNDNGIAENLPLNRMLGDYDIIHGTFFVCGLTRDDFTGSSSVNPAFTTIIGLCVANSFTALSGCLLAQSQRSVNIDIGTGMVTIALASLLIGGVFLGRKKMPLRIFGMVLGAFIFRLIYTIALRFDMPAFMLKFVSSVIVIAAIATPYFKKQLPLLKRRIQTRSGRRKADA